MQLRILHRRRFPIVSWGWVVSHGPSHLTWLRGKAWYGLPPNLQIIRHPKVKNMLFKPKQIRWKAHLQELVIRLWRLLHVQRTGHLCFVWVPNFEKYYTEWMSQSVQLILSGFCPTVSTLLICLKSSGERFIDWEESMISGRLSLTIERLIT